MWLFGELKNPDSDTGIRLGHRTLRIGANEIAFDGVPPPEKIRMPCPWNRLMIKLRTVLLPPK